MNNSELFNLGVSKLEDIYKVNGKLPKDFKLSKNDVSVLRQFIVAGGVKLPPNTVSFNAMKRACNVG